MHQPRTTLAEHPPAGQRGAILIISLLILLVLTVIGINSMDNAVMEQKMATNSRDAAVTFQEAETAIRNTYFAYQDNPASAISLAKNNIDDEAARTTRFRDDGNGNTSQSVITYIGEVPLINSSAGQFVAHGTEIAGIASKAGQGISSRTVQGYRTSPMPKMNP